MDVVEKNAYKLIVMLAMGTIATGTIVYHASEKLSWVDAYYFSVVTLSTVGYGDITPHTTFQKIFTTFYIFIGVGILTTFISVTMKRRGQKYITKQEQKKNKS
jgi:voltage-gated potassium channel